MKKTILKKTSILLAVFFVLTFAMIGCGGNNNAPESVTPDETAPVAETPEVDTPAEEPDGDGEILLGITMRETHEFFNKIADNMTDEGKKYGIKTTVQYAEKDIEKQIQHFENFMMMGCQYIFGYMWDQAGTKDIVEKATADGFYVISVDVVHDAALINNMLSNFDYGYKVGELAANYINSTPVLRDAERVEWALQTYSLQEDQITRGEGTKAAMEELAPNAVLVAAQDVTSTEEAVSVTENFIQANPNLKILCGATDGFVYGGYLAFEANGFTGEEYGCFGADGQDVAMELIAEDTMYRGTVYIDLDYHYRNVVRLIYDHSQGKEVPHENYFEYILVTKDNVDKYWP